METIDRHVIRNRLKRLFKKHGLTFRYYRNGLFIVADGSTILTKATLSEIAERENVLMPYERVEEL